MASSLPPNLFDFTTLASLTSTVAIVATAYAVSRIALPPQNSSRSSSSSVPTTPTVRFLFIWHLSDALCHFVLEGSFLYHCFFSWVDNVATDDGISSFPSGAAAGAGAGAGVGAKVGGGGLVPTPFNFLGHGNTRVYGPQAGGGNPFALLWMVYARADRRWAGADLGVISLELLTVFFDGPLACYICYLLARRDPRASIWMIVLATCELYGGFMTFCPEWLTGNLNLDTSNFMYMWVYLVFFNMLWVVIPFYVIWYAYTGISMAFVAQKMKKNK